MIAEVGNPAVHAQVHEGKPDCTNQKPCYLLSEAQQSHQLRQLLLFPDA